MMARSRNIKPSFFTNDELADLCPLTRLLFIGLWTIADREGRAEVRTKRIKAQLLPYDDCDVNAQLCALDGAGFISLYEVGETRYLQVLNFGRHQHPHVKEADSTIPTPDGYATKTPLTLNPLTDSLNPIRKTAHRFEEWWKEYPIKKDKKRAEQKWKARKLDGMADVLIADTVKRKATDPQWERGFIPLPTTYINGDRWEDEYETNQRRLGGACNETPVQRSERVEDEALGISH
jgi:hypothetical protein